MCIAVFIWKSHPLYPFFLLLNRDEFYSRPTQPLTWWELGEHGILGGRDKQAGGTWLASSRDGRVAFLTNFREVRQLSDPKSRGELPIRFLQSNKSPHAFAEEIVKDADKYNGFNLVLADLCTMTMVYVTNRQKELVTEVQPGIHVLTNASLDTPWPKAERLRHGFKELIGRYGETEFPIREMVTELMMDRVKDEESLLPKIYSPKREYNLSSIYVEADHPLGRFGTRSTSALSVEMDGEVCFYERRLDEEEWKEKTEIYQIEKKMS